MEADDGNAPGLLRKRIIQTEVNVNGQSETYVTKVVFCLIYEKYIENARKEKQQRNFQKLKHYDVIVKFQIILFYIYSIQIQIK